MTEQTTDALRACWLAWLQAELDESVADVFGYHAIQLGEPELDGLRANRMPHRWLIDAGGDADALCEALPFQSNTLDLVVLPHTFERSLDAHQSLREVERVLVPEGRVIIAGLNPFSLWGLRQRRYDWATRLGIKSGAKASPFEAPVANWIGLWRCRDWLKLLGFEVEVVKRGLYRPAWHSQPWVDRTAWMEATGSALWPFAASAYFLIAVKRVRATRLLGPAWRRQRRLVKVPVKSSARVRSTHE